MDVDNAALRESSLEVQCRPRPFQGVLVLSVDSFCMTVGFGELGINTYEEAKLNALKNRL